MIISAKTVMGSIVQIQVVEVSSEPSQDPLRAIRICFRFWTVQTALCYCWYFTEWNESNGGWVSWHGPVEPVGTLGYLPLDVHGNINDKSCFGTQVGSSEFLPWLIHWPWIIPLKMVVMKLYLHTPASIYKHSLFLKYSSTGEIIVWYPSCWYYIHTSNGNYQSGPLFQTMSVNDFVINWAPFGW